MHYNNTTKNIALIYDRVDNIYILNNVYLPTLTCLTIQTYDPWLWHRNLGHISIHSIEMLSKLELVNGLPKLIF